MQWEPINNMGRDIIFFVLENLFIHGFRYVALEKKSYFLGSIEATPTLQEIAPNFHTCGLKRLQSHDFEGNHFGPGTSPHICNIRYSYYVYYKGNAYIGPKKKKKKKKKQCKHAII